ncbi:Abi family protein [Gordonia sp. IITR100]|uniref:Abi family protein n=1 Tax=Gordonia sp. IITR100 TaxID=1314686 RepID=UPI0009912C01|nr:Abi family protein [Gordonia sp. IITR100]
MTRTTAGEAARLIGDARLAPYLKAANHDLDEALALYQWNMQLAAAFQEVLGFVEVSVRNAIDAQLKIWNPSRGSDPTTRQPYPADWTMNPAPPLRGLVKRAVEQAHVHAKRARDNRHPGHQRKAAPITHDDLVAQLSFSLWPKLLPSPAKALSGTPNLWSAALVDAFPQAAGNSANQVLAVPAVKLVHDRLGRLVKLRNRVAHMEPLLDVNITARQTDCLQVLGYMSPQARDWCAGVSRITAVGNARPTP